MNQHTPEQEPNDYEDFLKSGGEFLEYFLDGQVKRWRCGKNEQAQRVDPYGVSPKDIIHSLNNKGKWEGRIPSRDDLEEKETWSMER